MIQLIIYVAMNEVNVISCMGALKRDQIKYIQLAILGLYHHACCVTICSFEKNEKPLYLEV